MKKVLVKNLKNCDGSILQIILIVFMILTLGLSITSFYILQSVKNYSAIEQLMKQKNLEILLVKYYSDTVQNDILLSEDYMTDLWEIETVVDDLGNYYEVNTSVHTNQMNYSFLTWIEVETGKILKFEYL